MSRKDDFNLPSDRKGGGVRKFEQKTIKYGDGPSKNINKPKPKPTPKKENKVLKFLNEKIKFFAGMSGESKNEIKEIFLPMHCFLNEHFQ